LQISLRRFAQFILDTRDRGYNRAEVTKNVRGKEFSLPHLIHTFVRGCLMNSDYQSQKGAKKSGKESKETAVRPDGNHRLGLFEHAPIGIVECSLDGKYTNVNEEFCRITGYKKDELLNLDIHDLTSPSDLARETNIYKELTSGSIPFYNMEQRYIRRNGVMIWVGIIRSLVRDDDGKPLYTIGVVLDITHRRAVQEILRKSEAVLQEKNIQLEKRLQEDAIDLKAASLALVESQKKLEVLSQRRKAWQL
jgi:PAS domain S-box-containing protein